MNSKADGGHTPHEVCPAAKQWAQPWWLNAPAVNGRDVSRASRDARREFAVIAAQIGLAAWMLGTAMTSSCVTLDGFSATGEPRVTTGARASAPGTQGRPEVRPPAAGR